MPKQLFEIKDFLLTARRKDATKVTIKRNLKAKRKNTKFKLRTKQYLYTLVVRNKEKADKIEQSLPVDLEKVYVPKQTDAELKASKIKKQRKTKSQE